MRRIRHAGMICLFLLGCAVIVVQPEGRTNIWSTALPALPAHAISDAHAYFAGTGPTPTPACASSWRVVGSPNPSTSRNHLFDVAAIAANDVWAVGSYSIGTSTRSLALHWDGSQWSVIPTPNVGTTNTLNLLSGVAALATNNVWAVGYAQGGGLSQTLILHWDGSQWSVVPSPNPIGGNSPRLWKVSALAPDYIWAVGSYGDDGTVRTLVEFWNGLAWSIVPSPNPIPHPNSQNNELRGVTAISPYDVWATGVSFGGVYRTLVEHWDGSQWSVVPSPNLPGDSYNLLFAAAAVSSTDVWAVGTGVTRGGPPPPQTITMRWDGNLWQWSVVPSPNPGLVDNILRGVTTLSSNDVWAVGYILTGIRGDSLIEHWDGSQWTWVPSPSPGSYDNSLEAVAAVSSEDVWAVGDYSNGSSWYTLIEHYSNPCVTPSPTPSGTPPTLTPTRTRTPTPTGTRPTNTPTWTFIPTASGTPTNTPTDTRTPINTPNRTLTPKPCEPEANYVITRTMGASIVPGTEDTGNRCDDCTTTIELPFPFRFYGQSFTSANLSSNGNIQFGSNDPNHDNVCLPYAPFRYAILPHWDDLHTDTKARTGIFTSVSGVAPNRIFNIEWDATITPGGTGPVHFEVRLYENSPEQRFDIIYHAPSRQGRNATVGIQRETNEAFVQYECNTADTLLDGLMLTFALAPCAPSSATPAITLTPTFTPTRTPTPASTSVVTPTATVGVATSTVTPCLIVFTDVHESDYFYEAVRYLYCAGVISGYDDGTFRPYSNTTRAQMCKIIVLAEGWELVCPERPTFTDVPPTHPFYCYIETAVLHAGIRGYVEGDFRPYNDISRGQLSKIVVMAQDWQVDCPSTGHFSDVTPDYVFYCFIETAYAHDIISGYADGTFRPGNSATRGQICKIVYGAVTGP